MVKNAVMLVQVNELFITGSKQYCCIIVLCQKEKIMSQHFTFVSRKKTAIFLHS